MDQSQAENEINRHCSHYIYFVNHESVDAPYSLCVGCSYGSSAYDVARSSRGRTFMTELKLPLQLCAWATVERKKVPRNVIRV